MNPAKVKRSRVKLLTDLPNVGPAMARDLVRIGIKAPKQLVGKDPLKLYDSLSRTTGMRQDPCVLDVFISIIRFMDGEVPKPWWVYTDLRKRMYGPILDKRKRWSG